MYRVLAEALQPVADAAILYFKKQHGVTSVSIETEVDQDVSFRPTFHGKLPDKHLLCVEVSEVTMPPGIHEFIIQARNNSLPVRLWVVIPKGIVQVVDTKHLAFLRDNGVGLLELTDPQSATVLNGPPLSMSLTGLRQFRATDFPAKYRDAVRLAVETFRNGNPAKGCSEVYDIIESLTRKLVVKVSKVPGGLKQPLAFDPARENWAVVLEFAKKNLDRQAVGCPLLTTQLFNRLIGMTEYRNEAGHKPKTLEQLRNRDRQLRTRFESACDELLALIRATAPLKL